MIRRARPTQGCLRHAACGLLLLLSCGKGADPAAEIAAEKPNAELADLELRSSDMGRVQWIFKAKAAYLYQGRRTVEARTVYIEFFKADRKVAELTSDEATVDTETHDTASRGNVVLTSLSTGEKLQSDRLEWKAAREKITTQSPVTVTKGRNVIQAQGLEADPELGEITFVKGVRMDIQQVPSPGPAKAGGVTPGRASSCSSSSRLGPRRGRSPPSRSPSRGGSGSIPTPSS